jgi:hypothetical protein
MTIHSLAIVVPRETACGVLRQVVALAGLYLWGVAIKVHGSFGALRGVDRHIIGA